MLIGSTAYCSLASLRYLPTVLTAAKSLQRCSPLASIYILVIDISPRDIFKLQSLLPEVNYLSLEDVRPSLDFSCNIYNDLEFCCSLKPFLIQHIFSVSHLDYLIYFDSDSYFVQSPEKFFPTLPNSEIYLFSHLVLSNINSELLALRHGLFNAGFLIVSSSASNFIQWWIERCVSHCFLEPNQNIFVDQNWLSLVPLLFDSVSIVTHPHSFNVGYWNISSSNHDTICNYHLSGWNYSHRSPSKDTLFSAYSSFRIGNHINNLHMVNDLYSYFSKSLEVFDFNPSELLLYTSLDQYKVNPLLLRMQLSSIDKLPPLNYCRKPVPPFVPKFYHFSFKLARFFGLLSIVQFILQSLHVLTRSSAWSSRIK